MGSFNDFSSLITFTRAASILGVSRPTIYNLIKKHNLHPVVIGRNRYLRIEELEVIKKEVKDGAV